MPDPVASLVTAISAAKQLYELSGKIGNAQAKLLIAELHNSLADAKLQVAALKNDNLRLSEELQALKEFTSVEQTPQMRDGKLYLPQNPDIPYCPNCYHAADKLIPLAAMPPAFATFGKWRCGTCKGHYQ